MKSLVAVVSGEPHSINSEIIIKAWKKNKNIFIIGNYNNLQKQVIKLGLNTSLLKIANFDDIKKNKKLNVLDEPLKSKSIFNIKQPELKNYIFNSFDKAHYLAINKKISGFINTSIDKKIFKRIDKRIH